VRGEKGKKKRVRDREMVRGGREGDNDRKEGQRGKGC